MAQLSVLMSLYIKEKPEYAKACFDSLLRQTVRADEWVIVEDGPLTNEMYNLLDEYQANFPGLIKRIPLKRNQGLGLALRAGVLECRNELIARMDTDDISKPDRCEKQLKRFEEKPDLAIVGSHIDEFEIVLYLYRDFAAHIVLVFHLILLNVYYFLLNCFELFLK